MVRLSNDTITALIEPKGAELKSLRNTKLGIEYIWSSDPAFWAKSSPVLFPIVGQLKGDKYFFAGKEYSLPRHGFARDYHFIVELLDEEAARFRLSSSEATRAVYPFDFELLITYKLAGSALKVSYCVTNSSDGRMFFSLGAHPAFNVPLLKSNAYSDYFLQFEREESAERWPIISGGLIGKPSHTFLSSSRLPLKYELFRNDALVFKGLKSKKISILTERDSHGLDFTFEGFPFFGIWAAPNADFVCLEPWCGIADSIEHDQHLESKEGIEILGPKATWSRSWAVKTY